MSTENWMQSTSMADTIWNARWRELILGHGNWSVGSIRGTSSHHHNPFVILCDRNTEETYGDCYGYALAYSGNFLFETEVDQVGHTRVAMGIHPYHFSWHWNRERTLRHRK